MDAADLARVRDEIGDATPPADGTLATYHDELGHWILVALRVLKRRRAAAAGGSAVESFTLAGVLSVTQKANLKGLDDQIARLEAMYAAETGQSIGGGAGGRRLTRATAR